MSYYSCIEDNVTHVLTCWPPAPEDLSYRICAMLFGIVFLLSDESQDRAAAYCSSRPESALVDAGRKAMLGNCGSLTMRALNDDTARRNIAMCLSRLSNK